MLINKKPNEIWSPGYKNLVPKAGLEPARGVSPTGF